MAKHLDSPVLVAAAILADRYDITAYRVDVATPAVDIDYACGRTNDDASVTVTAERSRHVDGGADLDAAMAAATANIVGAVLTAAVQAQVISADAAAGIVAAVAGNPSLARAAYYAGTRDALYGLL